MWTKRGQRLHERPGSDSKPRASLTARRPKSWGQSLALSLAGAGALWAGAAFWGATDPGKGAGVALARDQAVERHDNDEGKDDQGAATRSSPIAITSDNKFVWSVNPDNDSVSVFRVAKDKNQKVDEIRVGKEPWCVAITPGKQQRSYNRKGKDDDDDNDNAVKVYVTNMVSGTVSVIDARKRRVVETIRVGAEPFGCALTPDGRRLYVANQSSETVSVIDTQHDRVIATIKEVGTKPHGIAITADGAKVYVTQFLSQRPGPGEQRPPTQSEGTDNGRVGRVTVIDAHSNQVLTTAILNPLPNVGAAFLSDGNTLAREPLTTVFNNVTGAFPNLLEAITVHGNRAYVPGTCSSPNGPFRFNVNVQSCLSTIDTATDVEAFGAGTTLNMNVGVNFEPAGVKLFNTNPFAIAFKRSVPEGFVVLAATDRLLRVTLDAAGVPTINPPANAGDAGNIVRIELKDPNEILTPDPDDTIGGKNPRGIALNSTDTRAYVMDFVSRDIAVVDISGNDPTLYHTIARIPSAALPAAGSVEAVVLRGKHLFNSAIGPEGEAANSKRPAGRMSDTGWGSCYSCHVQGLTDSVTWMFPDGPRQAISMESTFQFENGEPKAVIKNGIPLIPDSHQRALNWSAVRDEVQDFTRNVRAVSGGGGLVRLDALGHAVPEGVAGLAQLPDLRPTANAGLNADLDAIATYIALGVRAPISPLNSNSPGVRKGREAFENAGCQHCHGGPSWTASILDFKPPPQAAEIFDSVDGQAQLIRFLCRVGTFDATLFQAPGNEIRANNVANVQARGADGFNIPSLMSVFASPPYLHSGAAPTLDVVLENVTHRSAGSGGVDTLANASDRQAVVRFLKSIDRSTKAFPPGTPPANICGKPL
jgi:YVTN family beta-propeller protein